MRRFSSLPQPGIHTRRLLGILLPVLAVLLAEQILLYFAAPPETRLHLVSVLADRVECLCHCFAVTVGGALLLECAAPHHAANEKK